MTTYRHGVNLLQSIRRLKIAAVMGDRTLHPPQQRRVTDRVAPAATDSSHQVGVTDLKLGATLKRAAKLHKRIAPWPAYAEYSTEILWIKRAPTYNVILVARDI
ncbi:hypothetical protein ANOM_011879 [Aspergillus nomiae NRRL 13137]|uniref:Uncharacterized protein n=1 Tax=Aspergillus nomiae NRRL (strain ATCC 15546 / NRRL 13137 / CBS 260.88 / M93) TaxID=1509407 RepID=A0A0L1IL98_ASPN3|nr:uncharacterized protein ANOM_011879 [Aspergillus nomiae NRRL 13137]KNG79948.1 hypothetical protein ANOM_011879 [Aspergillus nomiae NRRL 13137]